MRNLILRHCIFLSLLGQTTYARGEEAPEKNIKLAATAEAVLRTEGPLVDIRINPDKTAAAFTDQRGQSLRILDLNTQEVVEVTPHRVDAHTRANRGAVVSSILQGITDLNIKAQVRQRLKTLRVVQDLLEQVWNAMSVCYAWFLLSVRVFPLSCRACPTSVH